MGKMKSLKIWASLITGLIAIGLVLFYSGIFATCKIVISNVEDSKAEASMEASTENETSVTEEESFVQEEVLAAESVVQIPETIVEVPVERNKTIGEPVANSSSLKIKDKLMSFGFQKANGRSIDTIIIHSSYDALGSDPYSVSGIIKEYEDYGVSAHYLIGRDGTIYRLVQEKDIAYHAGVSSVPDGRTGVNAFSIGIELVNTKTDKYTDDQYQTLNKLLTRLKSDYKIKYILGHNQIAPDRKDDPWNFDWSKLK